jgi:hypothetical protein
MKNWDKKLISNITSTVKVIGTTLPESKINHKPMDFPLVFAVLYETESYKKLNPSFMPGNLKLDKSQDTGWEIRKKYLEAGYQGKIFKGVNTRFIQNTSFKSLICALYYLDDAQIASHFGRGSSNGYAKYKNWYFRIPLVKKIYANKEKFKWINRCKEIVNEQSSRVSKI